MDVPRCEYLSIKEAAAYWGISEITVWRRIKAKELPALRLGKLWRIRKKLIHEYGSNQAANR